MKYKILYNLSSFDILIVSSSSLHIVKKVFDLKLFINILMLFT